MLDVACMTKMKNNDENIKIGRYILFLLLLLLLPLDLFCFRSLERKKRSKKNALSEHVKNDVFYDLSTNFNI